MAGKKDIVEQALKLVMGGAEKAAPKVVGTDAAGRPMLDFRGAVVSHFTDPESAADIWSHGYRQVGDGYYGRAVSFTPNREYGRQFGGVETNAIVSPEAKILDSGNPEHSEIIQRVLNDRSLAPTNPRPGQKTWDQKFRELGYDGLYDPGAGDLFIYNPAKVKPLPPEKASGGRIAKGPGGWVDDVVKMAGKAVMGGGEKAVGIIPGTFPGKKLPRVDALANNVDKFVYHSGVAEDIPSMKHGVDPQIGPWVKEVLEGSAEDDVVDEIMENAVPVSWWSKRPDWAVMKVARKLGKNPGDVTPEELAQHGHVALIPKKDPEAESMYWIGEQGLSSGPYSEVEDITGRKLKAYEADLYSGNYGPEGVERNEYITPRTVEPYLHLTGDELLDFLRKTGTYNKAHGGRARGGNNSISGALNVARGLNGGE